MRKLIVLILTAFIVSAFLGESQKPKDKREQKIQEEIQKRKEEYRLQKRKDCLEKILSAAEIHVDSLVAQEHSPLLSDTSSIPPRPARPLFGEEEF